jgi:hypothetical protein
MKMASPFIPRVTSIASRERSLGRLLLPNRSDPPQLLKSGVGVEKVTVIGGGLAGKTW